MFLMAVFKMVQDNQWFLVLLQTNQAIKKFFVSLKHFIKKTTESVLNSVTSRSEDDNNEEANFNGETLTFTIQKNKI